MLERRNHKKWTISLSTANNKSKKVCRAIHCFYEKVNSFILVQITSSNAKKLKE